MRGMAKADANAITAPAEPRGALKPLNDANAAAAQSSQDSLETKTTDATDAKAAWKAAKAAMKAEAEAKAAAAEVAKKAKRAAAAAAAATEKAKAEEAAALRLALHDQLRAFDGRTADEVDAAFEVLLTESDLDEDKRCGLMEEFLDSDSRRRYSMLLQFSTLLRTRRSTSPTSSRSENDDDMSA